MIPDITPVSQIDWDSAGARFYHVPFTLDHTWGRVRVPALRRLLPGSRVPTVVAIGGTHGDEYEGPVGLKNLIRELDPARLASGRLIVIPVLNVPAFRAARRDSPLDGAEHEPGLSRRRRAARSPNASPASSPTRCWRVPTSSSISTLGARASRSSAACRFIR